MHMLALEIDFRLLKGMILSLRLIGHTQARGRHLVRLKAAETRIRGTRRAGGKCCAKLLDDSFWTVRSLPFISPLEGYILVTEDFACDCPPERQSRSPDFVQKLHMPHQAGTAG